jgi:hypothetical protein
MVLSHLFFYLHETFFFFMTPPNFPVFYNSPFQSKTTFICLHLASLSLSVQLVFNCFSRKKESLLMTSTVESLSLVKLLSSVLSVCCVPVSSDRSKNFLLSFFCCTVCSLLLFYSSPVFSKPQTCAIVTGSNDKTHEYF